MNDITVILPIHTADGIKDDIVGAFESVQANRESYKDGHIALRIVCPTAIVQDIKTILDECKVTDYEIVENKGATDYCSQVNLGVSDLTTPYFSILEYDDEYAHTWFKMWHEYLYSREDVSVFLPINRQINTTTNYWQYCNELIWANSFSNELGYIDYDCLLNTSIFNLTGGVFNTEDFRQIGGYKTDIEVAFNYEFLLRAVNKKLKVFVVPKEGYYHAIDRKGSMTDHYINTMSHDEIKGWFEKASADYIHTENKESK